MPIEVTVWRRRLQVLIPAGILLVAVALIVPAILRAREAARRTQSRNNLRQIGLALANYVDTYDRLPPGGSFAGNGHGFHGWPTSVLPYMDASPLYNWIDHSQPWDASFNAGFFRTRLWWAANPSVRDDTPPDAYAVIHYSANARLVGANSSVRLTDVANASNTFLAGELGADFIPWGCPFNWRPLAGFDTQPHTYGRRDGTGGYFLMADGSVRWISPAVSDELLETLRGPDLAGAAGAGLRIERPLSFPVPADPWERAYVDFDEKLSCFGMRNGSGELRHLELHNHSKILQREPVDADLVRLKEFPNLTRLVAWGEFSDEGTSALGSLTRLESLSLSTENMSDAALDFLKQMPELKSLDLTRQRLTPTVVALLQGLSKLETLRLTLTEIGDDLPDLLKSLEPPPEIALNLVSDAITDDSLRLVSRIPAVHTLRVESRLVTLDGWRRLGEASALKTLEIAGRPLTAGEFQEIQKAVPQIRVYPDRPLVSSQ